MASNSALYGIIGALGVVVAGGGVYIAKQQGAFDPATSTASAQAPVPAPSVPAPAPTPTPPPAPAAAPPQPVPPPPASTTRAEGFLVHQLVGEAKRAIARADFSAADRTLDQAERLDPRSPELIDARRDLREAQQRAQREDRRIDGLVAQARAAIQRRDYATADRLLDQAENLDARDRDVQQARAELNAATRPAPSPAPGPGRR